MHNKKKEKKFDRKIKRPLFYLNFSSTATLKNKDNDFIYQICFFLSILVNSMYFCFLLFANTHHDHELIRVKH